MTGDVHTCLSALSVVGALSFLVWRAPAFCLQALFAGPSGVPRCSTGKVFTCSCNMYASIIHNLASPNLTAGMSHRPVHCQCQTLQVDWNCDTSCLTARQSQPDKSVSHNTSVFCAELWCHAVSTILLPASMPPPELLRPWLHIGQPFFSHAYISSLQIYPGQQ